MEAWATAGSNAVAAGQGACAVVDMNTSWGRNVGDTEASLVPFAEDSTAGNLDEISCVPA